jgi:DNA-binding XRE family transcriptional regulator
MDIKELRTALGMTQVEFASHIKVHPVTVCHWETGKFKPNKWLAKEIAKLERRKLKNE